MIKFTNDLNEKEDGVLYYNELNQKFVFNNYRLSEEISMERIIDGQNKYYLSKFRVETEKVYFSLEVSFDLTFPQLKIKIRINPDYLRYRKVNFSNFSVGSDIIPIVESLGRSLIKLKSKRRIEIFNKGEISLGKNIKSLRWDYPNFIFEFSDMENGESTFLRINEKTPHTLRRKMWEIFSHNFKIDNSILCGEAVHKFTGPKRSVISDVELKSYDIYL